MVVRQYKDAIINMPLQKSTYINIADKGELEIELQVRPISEVGETGLYPDDLILFIIEVLKAMGKDFPWEKISLVVRTQ